MPQEVVAHEFESVLAKMPRPRGRQLEFLKAHATATARALNMRRIARAANYVDYRGANLQSGRLAKRIGQALGRPNADLNLLVEFVPPKGRDRKHISNDEWILVMREPFANALKRVGW